MKATFVLIMQAAMFQVYGSVGHQLEVIMTVSAEELVLDGGELAIVMGERLIPIQSAERAGNFWKVRLDADDIERCPDGHQILCACGGCGISSCRFSCPHLADDPYYMKKAA